jgi:hypothetical protein
VYLPKLLDRITARAIEVAYDFDVQGVTNSTVKAFGIAASMIDIHDDYGNELESHVVYRIELTRPDGNSILEFPFIRYLYPRRELWGPYCKEGLTLIGRVAYNANFSITLDFQHKGIAKVIYQLEDALYRRWGADEIQLSAAQTGKVVWRRFGFMLHCDEVGIVEYLYEEWCGENGVKYSVSREINMYPEAFLLSTKIKNFRMYKELK